jgi:RNA polymerase sigma factor (TIGR02999 family)
MSDPSENPEAAGDGGPHEAGRLLPLVYDELRRLAARRLAHEKPGQTLDATALVHEAYLRLTGGPAGQRWDDRGHFFAAAAEAMRRILIDNARRKRSRKHGGGRVRLDLDDVAPAAAPPDLDLVALDEALTRLAARDKVKADLVQLRYFAGLTLTEAASVLGIAPATADRYWAYARAWLHREITRGEKTEKG